MKRRLLLLIFFLFKLFCSWSQKTAILTPETFGAKADAVILYDGAIDAGSNIFISQTANFSFKDQGKIIFVNGANKAHKTLISSIATVLNDSSVRLSDKAVVSVRNSSITYGTNSTDAFIKLNNKARQLSNNFIVIECKTGIYLTKFNNWLAGIKNIEVNGNNGSIICTNGAYDPDGYTASNNALYLPSVFDNVDNHYYSITGSYSYANNTSYGYTFHTNKVGTNYINLIDGRNTANFKKGDWALLGGFEGENYGGFPPLYRFFEYARVKEIDIKKGKIEFEYPLKNQYDEQWPDSTWKGGKAGLGAPRILNCSRNGFTIIENLSIQNLNFLPFNGWVGKQATLQRNGRIALYGFINGKFNNITMNAAYVGTCRKAEFNKCITKEYFEPDKEIDTLTFINCWFNDFVLGPGINVENLVNSTFTGKFSASPRKLYAKGNLFATESFGSSQGLINPGGNSGTDEVRLESNTFQFTEPRRAIIAGSGFTILSIDSIINNNLITVSFDNWGKANNGRQVVPGKTGITSAGKTLLVKKVFRYASGVMGVEGVFSAAPVNTDKFVFSYLPHVIIVNKQVKTGVFKKGNTKFFLDLKKIQQTNINDSLVF